MPTASDNYRSGSVLRQSQPYDTVMTMVERAFSKYIGQLLLTTACETGAEEPIQHMKDQSA